MKVRMSVTIDVDTDAWTANYGTEPGQIRADVISHVTNLLSGTYVDQLETATAVTVK